MIILISLLWEFSTPTWMTVSFLKSLGLFSVFWSVFAVLTFGWSPLALLFPSLTDPLPILWWLYRVHLLQLLLLSLLCSLVFSVPKLFQFPSKVQVFISLFAFFQFNLWSARTAKSTIRQVLFFFVCCLAEIIIIIVIVIIILDDPQNHWVYVVTEGHEDIDIMARTLLFRFVLFWFLCLMAYQPSWVI